MDERRNTRIPEIRTETNPFKNNRGERVAEVPAYSSQNNTLNEPTSLNSRPPNSTLSISTGSNLSNDELVID